MNEQNDRQIDMSQRLYPGSFAFGAENFTPDMQAQIIKGHFEGTDSVHSMISQKLYDERQLAQQPQQPQIPSDELQYLRKLGEFAKTPQFAKALASVMAEGNQPQQPQQTFVPPTQPQVQQPVRTDTPSNDPFADLFPSANPVNNQQFEQKQPGQDQSGQDQQRQNQQLDSQTYEQLIGLCAKNQIDVNDFVQFMGSLTEDDMVILYKEFKKAGEQAASQQPQQPQTQQQFAPQVNEPPKSVQNIPPQSRQPVQPGTFNPMKRNPLWD